MIKEKLKKPETIIKKFGYEYVLVESTNRAIHKMEQPCMFGMPNMALKAVRKIKKQ